MNELAGGLIQMNAHMVTKPGADAVMLIGGVLMVLCFVLAICAIVQPNKRAVVVFAVMAVFGAALYFGGRAVPKVKEIHACVSGPVSLEQVATVYNIVKIDGKELILRER